MVLEYTHDPLDVTGGDPSCADTGGATPFQDGDGQPMRCEQLA
eukprot:SAG25_NODE_5192_length_691_cov_1.035473_2_plen_42_part_01